MQRLSAQTVLPAGVHGPAYRPSDRGVGIVHIGLGAFHKAHQAVHTDAALAARDGDWRIAAVSLRNPEPAADLAPQDGRYTVIERGPGAPRAQVVGSIAEALCLGDDRARIEALLDAPGTRVVTITVTEKGYGLDRGTGGVDPDHPAIRHDLADPQRPVGLAGLLIAALARRRAAGIAPFTILSCDNLPENGRLLNGLLVDFAARTRPDLAPFIDARSRPPPAWSTASPPRAHPRRAARRPRSSAPRTTPPSRRSRSASGSSRTGFPRADRFGRRAARPSRTMWARSRR
jgi:fructuronate reductase